MVSILGINVTNCSRREAIERMEKLILQEPDRSHSIYIVNAHTLNLAKEDTVYHNILNDADAVLGDGTGVRWAAKLRNVRMKDNLVGTDLVPQLFEATAGRGYRYFLLGSIQETIERAANVCSVAYPGWSLAGYHHGHFDEDDTQDVIQAINAARPHLLLVGMGNPTQEKWIHAHKNELRVPVCVGVGGLFDHWAGNLTRAPLWVRHQGFEWLQLLLQQPHKWRRYLIGNPKFLFRIARERFTQNTETFQPQ